MMNVSRAGMLALTVGLVTLTACERQQVAERDGGLVPAMLRPFQSVEAVPPPTPLDDQIADLTTASVAFGVGEVSIIDTTKFVQQIVKSGEGRTGRRVREMLPEHSRHSIALNEAPNMLPVGEVHGERRAVVDQNWPGISQTGWVPPDPNLAVGPHHIVTTVNQDIAFYSKTGTLLFQQPLNDTGNPGFFEPVGAGGFTFDPKVFFDHYAQRFVVVAPEVYGSTQAWISIAVSDDDNPLGTWYKYRTNAVIQVGGTTYWWDYPGFGYDEDGYYVTSNLFGLNQGGWGGVGFRVFDKTAMLSGQPVVFSTMRDGNAASVQVAHHFGSNAAPFFISGNNSSSLRVHAITNPLTNPQLVSTTVTVPSYSGPVDSPAVGASAVQTIDSRIFNAQWRNGNLYATHNIGSGGKTVARWYHVNTNNWPTSGNVSLVQSGNVNAGGDVHTFFPAIFSNNLNEVAMVMGASSSSTRISVNVTGRRANDPLGTMGALTQLHISSVNTGGRWGDYYDICTDPNDDRTFWVIGQYGAAGGWNNWIASFRVSEVDGPYTEPDAIDFILGGSAADVDVLANDGHTDGDTILIDTFDAVSAQGGTVERLVGVGPGGRDVLRYTAPTGYTGPDSFEYTIRDSQNRTADAVVSAAVFDPTIFLPAVHPLNPLAGLDAGYYVLSNPSVLPNFDALTAYASEVVPNINYASTNGNFAGSGRADNVGALYRGFVQVPQLGVYTFYTTSDDGSALYIDGVQVVDNDGLHGMQERWGTVPLQPGLHEIRVEFFEAGGGAGLIVEYGGPGVTRQVIPAGVLRRVNPCPIDLMPPFGVLDFFDVQVFLGMFSAEDPQTDLNGDGVFDFFDIQIYLALVSQGC
ncbi:MAG: hypothetical protein KF757_04675 [Phycisphaeraceae bacterium]|nr:hypothetical protein [Phycisphaeraceae bacterium]MCW5764256.1 hypothetical protein [Phycisphaeraceae bacterium]